MTYNLTKLHDPVFRDFVAYCNVRGCALLLRIVRRRHSRLVSLRLKFADTGFECTGAYKNDVEAALASAIRLYVTEHLGK